MKLDRRFLQSWDTPVNGARFNCGKVYVRYIDGERTADMTMKQAIQYLNKYGGRICYSTEKSNFAASDIMEHSAGGFVRWLRSLETIATDRQRRNPLKEASINGVKLPRIGALYRQPREARSLPAIAAPSPVARRAERGRPPIVEFLPPWLREAAASDVKPPAAAGIERAAVDGDNHGRRDASQDHRDWRDDRQAVAFMRKQGYRMDRGYNWHPPEYREPTPLEWSAINYLFNEWDWGGVIRETPCVPKSDLG